MISISDKTCTDYKLHIALQRKNRIIIHDGWQYYMGGISNEKQLKEFLEFLEIETTTIDSIKEYESTGKIIFYNLSKNINSPCDGGFWSIEQLKESSKGQKLKKFKGLSNGSMVDCYIGISDDIIEVYRPNPNAKEVYKPMELWESIEYKKNNWYL
jgi:hypothetical protein